jgi:hypothetical protein
MVQHGCLVVNSAHSWRAGYLQSDFYERNQVALDVILRGVSCDIPKPSSPVEIAVVSPSKRGEFAAEEEEPIPSESIEKSASQTVIDGESIPGSSSKEDNSVVVSIGSTSGVFLDIDDVSTSGGNTLAGPAGPSDVPSCDPPESDGEDDRLTPAILRRMKSMRDHPILALDDFELLCASFGRSELQELLDMSSSEEDAPEMLLTVAEFRARMAKPKRYVHRGKYIPYYGAGGERSDNRGQWYHHCSICHKQFTTRASVNRHLNPAQENSHPGCFIAFDDKYPPSGEDDVPCRYRLCDLQRDFSCAVACHRLRCALSHCKSGTAVTRVKPVRRAERTRTVKKPVHFSDDDTESDDAATKSPRSARQRSLDRKYRMALRLDQKGQKRRRK